MVNSLYRFLYSNTFDVPEYKKENIAYNSQVENIAYNSQVRVWYTTSI